jgi:hypothetical protein
MGTAWRDCRKPLDENLEAFCFVSIIFIKQRLIELHNKPLNEIEQHFFIITDDVIYQV